MKQQTIAGLEEKRREAKKLHMLIERGVFRTSRLTAHMKPLDDATKLATSRYVFGKTRDPIEEKVQEFALQLTQNKLDNIVAEIREHIEDYDVTKDRIPL